MTINDRLREYRPPVFRNFGQALATAWHMFHVKRYGQRETNERTGFSEARG